MTMAMAINRAFDIKVVMGKPRVAMVCDMTQDNYISGACDASGTYNHHILKGYAFD